MLFLPTGSLNVRRRGRGYGRSQQNQNDGGGESRDHGSRDAGIVKALFHLGIRE